jgi:hypothetical protein
VVRHTPYKSFQLLCMGVSDPIVLRWRVGVCDYYLGFASGALRLRLMRPARVGGDAQRAGWLDQLDSAGRVAVMKEDKGALGARDRACPMLLLAA